MIGFVFMALALDGCASVRKGAGRAGQAVGDGIGSVAKGTGNVVKGVGGVFSGLAPKKQQVELEPGEETDREVIETVEDGEVKRFVLRRPSLNPFGTYPFKRLPVQEGDASTNQLLREQAWARIIKFTKFRQMGDDRARIDVTSPFIMEIEEMEYILLGRAAGEAARAGYKSFSIVYLNYEGGRGLGSLLVPEINLTTNDWIGSYEELVIARENQRLTGNYSKIGGKNIEAVVLFLPEEDRRRRETFPATDVYLAMMNEGVFDDQFPYDEK